MAVLVKLQVKPDQIDNLRPLFASLLQETRCRDGNEGVTVHQYLDDPLQVLLIEMWVHRQVYETYNQWHLERGVLATLAALLEGPQDGNFSVISESNTPHFLPLTNHTKGSIT